MVFAESAVFHLVSVFFGVVFSFGVGRKDRGFCFCGGRADFFFGEGRVDTGGQVLLRGGVDCE